MKNQSCYDVVVVGAGAAGLTSAAYLCKYGYSVLLCEKEEQTGGLVGAFNHNGFHFDSGIRAFENSGIIFPMLKQLGIEMEFTNNRVSIGIKDSIIYIDSKESLWEYEKFLSGLFPENTSDIHNIILEINDVIEYMDVLYGIDNPLFLDFKEDLKYIFKTLIPWFLKYQININKAMKLDEVVDDYLLKFTDNRVLIDMITQHFFKDTPTFFALSYFGLYLDYSYPVGGTGVLSEKLSEYIESHNGDILTSTEVSEIDIKKNKITTADGKSFDYKKLIWAGDSKTLYDIIDTSEISIENNENIEIQKELTQNSHGGDSILTVYLGVDLDKSYFKTHCGGHLFYTPELIGLSSISLENWSDFENKSEIKRLMSSFLERTTFEISCPVLRDESLAPEGKTGLIISTLIDYELVKGISDADWYDEFKEFCINKTIDVLNDSIFKNLRENVIFSICSTPLTIKRLTGNDGGAITGWAFTSEKMPSETRFKKISKSVLTPIPDIFQAGQWTFSPSGLPISILTGKLAADEVNKKLKNKHGKGQK